MHARVCARAGRKRRASRAGEECRLKVGGDEEREEGRRKKSRGLERGVLGEFGWRQTASENGAPQGETLREERRSRGWL